MSGPEETVEVIVDSVTYRASDGPYAVVRVERTSASPADAVFHAVGDLGDVREGETLRLSGTFVVHPTHGRQFQIRAFTPVLPTHTRGIVKLLAGLPNLGEKLAESLVARFGTRTLDVIAQESARLREVKGIGERRVRALREAILTRRAEAEGLSFLHGLGLGPALARRLLRRYGDDAVRVLRDDPYRVAEEVPGIGFTTADTIGRAVGIGADDPRRIAGIVLHLVGRAADAGHTYVRADDLRAALPEFGLDASLLPPVLRDLEIARLLAFEGDALFAPPVLAAERRLAERLAALLTTRAEVPPELASATDLSDEQREAVLASFRHGVSVLTGGPGTGKTTTVRTLVQAHVDRGRSVVLAAPTGRAAKRLSDASGLEARTIHRLLEWNPGTGAFRRGPDSPLEADLVLVDESSMMDLRLADRLVAAVRPGARLVLVGDVDQLPPVGAGHAFREILRSECIPTTRLRRVFRQAEASAIVRGAHAILRGEAPTPSERGALGAGELHYVVAEEADALTPALDRVLERITAAYGFDPEREVQLLAPMRKGPFGTDALNEWMRRRRGVRAKAGRFFEGERVMQLRNDYDLEVWNGDVGEVVGEVEGGLSVRVDGRIVVFGPDQQDDLTLAYASTVHKVQGSEFPAVVFVLHGSHHVMLERSLLYTGITRAKRLVVLLGSRRAVQRAARTTEGSRARSRLSDRLRAACDERSRQTS